MGRYSVKCQVSGGDDTQVNEGFIINRYIVMTKFYLLIKFQKSFKIDINLERTI